MTLVSAKGTTLDSQARGNILKALRQTASDKVKTKSPCLEPCLRQLESMLAELPQHSPGKFFWLVFWLTKLQKVFSVSSLIQNNFLPFFQINKKLMVSDLVHFLKIELNRKHLLISILCTLHLYI